MKTTFLHIFLLLSVMDILVSCNKEEIAIQSLPTKEEEDQANTKAIVITSTPGENTSYYGMMVFEIEKIDAYVERIGWINLSNQKQQINTFELENGSEWLIAKSDCKYADLIRKIKLTFGQQNYLNADGSFSGSILEMSLKKGFEVVVSISPQNHNDDRFMLNIDLGASIIQANNQFYFKPVIHYVGDIHTGIKGMIAGIEQAKVMLNNPAATYHTFLSSNGEFMIRGVKDGIYTLTITPISSNPDAPPPKLLEGIRILKGQLSSIQEIRF